MTARLLLVRHCQSSGQAPDAPITQQGQAQALVLAEHLAQHPVDHLISSPYLRARETIAPFAGRTQLVVHVDQRLAERRIASEPIDHWREVVRESFVDLDHQVPGGESGRETLRRGWAAVNAALAGGHRLPALVSHGQLLSLVLHSIDSGFGFAGWESLSNPDVYLVEGELGGPFKYERVWV